MPVCSISSKRAVLNAAKLYVVLDTAVFGFTKLFNILKQTVAAGTLIVQLRSKDAATKEIITFLKKARTVTKNKALLIVNDWPQLVTASGGDGVHLGQDDLTLKEARVILGADKLIGISCQTLLQAKQAQKDGADYIGFGSVFKTQTKPDRQGLELKVITKISREINIPVFFIGGITLTNVQQVIKSGGKRIAVTRAVCKAADVQRTTVQFLNKLRRTDR